VHLQGAEVFELGDQPSSVGFVGATFAPARAEVGVSKRRDPVSSKVQQSPSSNDVQRRP
jgi:hypothetical protein